MPFAAWESLWISVAVVCRYWLGCWNRQCPCTSWRAIQVYWAPLSKAWCRLHPCSLTFWALRSPTATRRCFSSYRLCPIALPSWAPAITAEESRTSGPCRSRTAELCAPVASEARMRTSIIDIGRPSAAVGRLFLLIGIDRPPRFVAAVAVVGTHSRWTDRSYTVVADVVSACLAAIVAAAGIRASDPPHIAGLRSTQRFHHPYLQKLV